jgi:hypothetical protein
LDRVPRATKASEAAFLALGDGATPYLVEAAASGTRRLERKMAEAVTLSALHGTAVVDRALGVAAMAGRFAEGDLESIIVHASGAPPAVGDFSCPSAGRFSGRLWGVSHGRRHRIRSAARGFHDPESFITMIMPNRAGIAPQLPWVAAS